MHHKTRATPPKSRAQSEWEFTVFGPLGAALLVAIVLYAVGAPDAVAGAVTLAVLIAMYVALIRDHKARVAEAEYQDYSKRLDDAARTRSETQAFRERYEQERRTGSR